MAMGARPLSRGAACTRERKGSVRWQVPRRCARLLVVVVGLTRRRILDRRPAGRQPAAGALRLSGPAVVAAELFRPTGPLKLVDGALRIRAVQAHLVAVRQGHRLAGLHPGPRLVRGRSPAGRLLALRIHVDARAVFGSVDDALVGGDVHLLALELHHVVPAKGLLVAAVDVIVGLQHPRSAIPGKDMPDHVDGGARCRIWPAHRAAPRAAHPRHAGRRTHEKRTHGGRSSSRGGGLPRL
mmetsp:Transcript_29022/g.86761  ORF Transcript_29022/g.86761 Transcript_29022/m.86761 type:complete len:240 (-) Transcript_29022:12-731(-)